MDICLGYWSALECWRSLRQCSNLPASYIEKRMTSSRGSLSLHITDMELEQLKDTYGLSGHIHCVVSKKRGQHSRAKVTSHIWSDDKLECFAEISEGLYISSPAACFLQLSTVLDLVDCVRLGFELCSHYVLVGDRLEESEPLMSVADAREAIAACGASIGKKRALRALEFVAEGSRSPMESELAIKLALPTIYGGFGLGGFEMNAAVPLGKWGRELTGKDFCRPDLLWGKQRIDLEYNGAEWHSSRQQVQDDARRRQALIAEGYTLLNVDRLTIRDCVKMRCLADRVSYYLRERRLRIRAKDFDELNRGLFERFEKKGAHVKVPL